MSILERVRACGVVAIVRLDDLTQAVDLSNALVAGGVNVIEFTLTNPDAVEAIATVRATLGDTCVIGAGSVITAEQVKQVADAGAAFVVSPVTDARVVKQCHAHDLPVMPGAYTPSEIQQAWEMGAAVVKVFPARGLGPKYIKDVLAPLPHLRLIPTGGVSNQNAGDYIRAGAFAVGAGGSLVDPQVVNRADWQTLTDRARELVAAVETARS